MNFDTVDIPQYLARRFGGEWEYNADRDYFTDESSGAIVLFSVPANGWPPFFEHYLLDRVWECRAALIDDLDDAAADGVT
jgi:hypothetical protein